MPHVHVFTRLDTLSERELDRLLDRLHQPTAHGKLSPRVPQDRQPAARWQSQTLAAARRAKAAARARLQEARRG